VSRLFPYVVEHDRTYGTAPNPYGGFCTLALCKFGSPKRPNIVELAQVGDRVAGTGGVGPDSAGHGKLIYAMRVDEKLTLEGYSCDPRFADRPDNLVDLAHCSDRFVLVSEYFFYFGARAVDLGAIPTRHLDHPFEKRGPGFRRGFSAEFIADFVRWLEQTYCVGVSGDPCGGRPAHAPRCVSRQVRFRASRRRTGHVSVVCSSGRAYSAGMGWNYEDRIGCGDQVAVQRFSEGQ
jgi:hypothetical protein